MSLVESDMSCLKYQPATLSLRPGGESGIQLRSSDDAIIHDTFIDLHRRRWNPCANPTGSDWSDARPRSSIHLPSESAPIAATVIPCPNRGLSVHAVSPMATNRPGHFDIFSKCRHRLAVLR